MPEINPQIQMEAMQQRLADQQREFMVLQRAFSLVSAEKDAMQHLLRVVQDSPSIDDTLDQTVALMMKLLKAEAGSLFLINWETDELLFKVAKGPAGEKVKGFRVKMGEGIVGWVATENEAVSLSDVDRDPRFKREISSAVGYEVRSILAVPFRVRGRLVGVFELLNKEGGDVFLADDRDIIQNLANYLGRLLQLSGREQLE